MGFRSPKPVVRWLWPLITQLAGTASGNSIANEVLLTPVQIPFPVKIDQILVHINLAAGNVRIGVYSDNGDTPAGGALLFQAPSQAVVATPTVFNLSPAWTLQPGLYWFACQFDDTTASNNFFNTVGLIGIGTFFNSVFDGCSYTTTSYAFQNIAPSVTKNQAKNNVLLIRATVLG